MKNMKLTEIKKYPNKLSGSLVKIIDSKLPEFGGEYFLLWNINNDRLWALGLTPSDSIATFYAGGSQFKIIEKND